MKKNVKVFEIKAITANGNDRTVHAVVTLDVTLADVCKMNNIPMLSIISTNVTAPMTVAEATCYTFQRHAALVLVPNVALVKCTVSMSAA